MTQARAFAAHHQGGSGPLGQEHSIFCQHIVPNTQLHVGEGVPGALVQFQPKGWHFVRPDDESVGSLKLTFEVSRSGRALY